MPFRLQVLSAILWAVSGAVGSVVAAVTDGNGWVAFGGSGLVAAWLGFLVWRSERTVVADYQERDERREREVVAMRIRAERAERVQSEALLRAWRAEGHAAVLTSQIVSLGGTPMAPPPAPGGIGWGETPPLGSGKG